MIRSHMPVPRNRVPYCATVYLMGGTIHIKVKETRVAVPYKTARDAWDAALGACEQAGLDGVDWVRAHPPDIMPSTPRRAAVAAIRAVHYAQQVAV